MERVCVDCGAGMPAHPGAGRPRIRCQPCAEKKIKADHALYAETDSARAKRAAYRKKYACKRCGAEFLAQSYRAHCSKKCLAEYEAGKLRKATCRKCGVEFRPKSSRYTKYCSRACAFEDIAAWRNVGAKLNGNSEAAPIKKPAPTERFIELTAKRGKRANKVHVTRAKKIGVEYEHFNQFLIFERDGWKCKICGVSTPIEKRGTYDDDAPELDHIIPMSKGGAHTINNSQCACRKCNRHKSDNL